MALGKGLGSLIPAKNAPKPASTQARMQMDSSDEPSRAPIQKTPTKEITLSTDSNGALHIQITKIAPNADQPRRFFAPDALEELTRSIKEHGIIQPLTVTKTGDDRYELIAGERRFRAAKQAGLTEVPVVVKDGSEQEKFEWALIENIQRQDLNPIEEARAYERLVDEFGLTQQEIADRVGKSRPAVANMLRLLALPDEIHEALISGTLSMGKARALLSLKDESEQIALFRSMIGEKMSVRDVERAVSEKSPQKRKGIPTKNPNVHAHEQALEEALNTKVRVTQKGDRGTIVLHYFSIDELRRLINMLRGDEGRMLE